MLEGSRRPAGGQVGCLLEICCGQQGSLVCARKAGKKKAVQEDFSGQEMSGKDWREFAARSRDAHGGR